VELREVGRQGARHRRRQGRGGPDTRGAGQGSRGAGVDAKGVDIKVEGDKVVLSGAAVSKEVKEKLIVATGNVAGVSAVEESVSAPDGDADPVFYTVKKGDTLWAISEETLGSGARYKEIFEANRPMLSHPDKIYPGQVLRIVA
jgi:nucleoid-associated protein YgaU